jgi:glyoxylase-like metal-dependent hydrolase (beta-lactamase superfamily II)
MWFHTRLAADGVWVVGEPPHVSSFLVAGSERAVLLDTGLGLVPVRPVAEGLTRLPLSVVNTHSDFDHVGGNHEFAEIAIHELGAPELEREEPPGLLEAYAEFVRGMLANRDEYRRLDRAWFSLLTADVEARALPDGVDLAAWRIEPSRATRTLADGDRIDLGGRALTVLHTPGHTPDSICLLDDRDGLLFAGDTVYSGELYAQESGSDLAAYAASVRRLAELARDVRLVFPCHGPPVVDPMLLVEAADGLERLLAGGVELEPDRDFLGDDVRIARFARFAVCLPPGWMHG